MANFGDFSFGIVVHGKSLREYHHQNRIWIMGKNNSSYKLLFRNHKTVPVLAVISIDGLDVIEGKEADYHESTGYVVGPMETLEIPGWRLDNEEVAKFVFGRKDDGYASQSGSPENSGVVGVAVFDEKSPFNWFKCLGSTSTKVEEDGSVKPWVGRGDVKITWTTDCTGYPADYCIYLSNDDKEVHGGDVRSCYYHSVPIPNAGEVIARDGITVNHIECDFNPVQDMGTQFGKRHDHRVDEISFSREDEPFRVAQIHYASKRALFQMGVIRPETKASIARAFPANSGKGCTPPKDWKHGKKKVARR